MYSRYICLDAPFSSPGNAQLLAPVFSLYHSAHNMFKGDDVSPMPRAVQRNLVEAASIKAAYFIIVWEAHKTQLSYFAWNKIHMYSLFVIPHTWTLLPLLTKY